MPTPLRIGDRPNLILVLPRSDGKYRRKPDVQYLFLNPPHEQYPLAPDSNDNRAAWQTDRRGDLASERSFRDRFAHAPVKALFRSIDKLAPFLERRLWLWKCAGRERRNRRVETAVPKRKIFRVRDQKPNIHGQFCGSGSRDFQHFYAAIQGDDPATRRIIRQLFPSSGSDFEHLSGRSPEQFSPQSAYPEAIRDPLYPVIPRRKAVVFLG